MRDQYGRTINYLRLSITDRCNFRCRYCMPEEHYEWIPREQVLTFEEIDTRSDHPAVVVQLLWK